MDPARRPYRILSLDGGGCWSLLQVLALEDLYGDLPGHDLLAHFDLVAANSGGAIVAAGLAEGLPLGEIKQFFLSADKRRAFFRPLPWSEKYLGLYSFLRFADLGPRYAEASKRATLCDVLPRTGALPLHDLPDRIQRETGHRTEFLLIAFDRDLERALFLRSQRDSRAASSSEGISARLAEAVNASSNAPVNYFDRPAPVGQHRCWDGAMTGCNNPVLIAVVEALANGHAPQDIAVLSVGTGTVRLPLRGPKGEPPLTVDPPAATLPDDLREVAGSILDDPPDLASFCAHVALGGPLPTSPDAGPTQGNLVRLSPVVRPIEREGKWTLPDGLSMEEFRDLSQLGIDAVEDEQIALIAKLGELWLTDRVPNQPIRADLDYHCEVGQERYREGRNAWKKLAPAGERDVLGS